jgi:hypothetical protein
VRNGRRGCSEKPCVNTNSQFCSQIFPMLRLMLAFSASCAPDWQLNSTVRHADFVNTPLAARFLSSTKACNS